MQPKLEITLQADGNISVTGPINQTLLCYGMLDLAKDAIRTHAATADKRIALAGPGDVLAIGKKPS